MAISINWGTKVITVPKDDLILTQVSPEVRELNLDWFRLELKNLEDDPEGMPFPDTHKHTTEVTLSGLTYARIVEIINGYTVEFEDGQYTINCVGANHNLSDVKVANQVSLIINNAAGLITNTAIEFSSFNGGVTVDTASPYSGTSFPIGTAQRPVNNMVDGLMIADYRGLTTFFISGDITLDDSSDFSQYNFIGESMNKTTITIDSDADVSDCEFYEATLQGTLDGDCKVKDCRLLNINYISGYIELCVLDGVITLGGGASAYFLDCWAGSNLGNPPEIDLGGSGQTLVMQNFNGYIKWKNKSGIEQANATLNAGWIELDSTITAGIINIIGVGTVDNNSTGTTIVNTDHLVDAHYISEMYKSLRNKKSLVKEGLTWYLIIYDNDGISEIFRKALKDKDGNEITDLTAGTLAEELASSV